MTQPTSISDTQLYRAACHQAATDPVAFSNFRRHHALTQIWEHVGYEYGQQYLDLIDLDRYHPAQFTQNDSIGGAELHYYPKIGMNYCPSTLRYVQVLQELDRHFDLKSLSSIAEIGGAYGGQASVIQKYTGNQIRYSIFDLPEVEMLALSYLQRLGYNLTKCYGDCSYDLVFSNYAFCELAAPTQQGYFDTVISKSSRVYMVYSHISTHFGVTSWHVSEFVQKLQAIGFSVSLYDELPVTGYSNSIVVATR
jgi:hypothetical protein